MNRSAAMKARWADPDWRARTLSSMRHGKPERAPKVTKARVWKASNARFAAHTTDGDVRVLTLSQGHSAVVNAHSIFRTLRDPGVGDHVLISGMNQRKIGHRITKGPWAGLPVYTLSLEERATCPRSCRQWRTCYGNSMPYAARWKHGPAFERTLFADLFWHAGRHPRGFAVRIHVLGDFYSEAYIDLWREALESIPGLRVWGYTARESGTPLGDAVARLNADYPERCVIRRSGAVQGAMRSVVINRASEAGEAIVCPAELGKTKNCGTCGLCWAPAATDKTIAFLLHGNPARGRPIKIAA